MQSFEPPRPNGSLWRLPGTTTLASTDGSEADDPGIEPIPPFCMGQYKIVAVLGRGGMGVVYRGVHATLRREVAIKLLGRAHFTPERRRQFALEAEILRRLRHPGIARLVYADTVSADGPTRDAGPRQKFEWRVHDAWRHPASSKGPHIPLLLRACCESALTVICQLACPRHL